MARGTARRRGRGGRLVATAVAGLLARSLRSRWEAFAAPAVAAPALPPRLAVASSASAVQRPRAAQLTAPVAAGYAGRLPRASQKFRATLKRTALAVSTGRALFYGLFVAPNSFIVLFVLFALRGVKRDVTDGDAMQTMWASYSTRPAARAASLMAGIVRFGFWGLRAKLARNKDKQHELNVRAGKQVVQELLALGPTYVKLGQIISCRPDLVPDEFVQELKTLQDGVPAFSGKRAIAILEEELKKPISELYKEFDEKPLAAASLGQVHRATLHDGRQVAIKVQRDKLKEMYDLDLAQFDKITGMLDKFKIGAGDLKWSEIFKDAKVILYREIDYNAEAENTRKFVKAFEKEKWIKIPNVIDEYTSEKVLTMEYVPGVKIDNLATLDSMPAIDRKVLAKNLARAYLLQFCKYGVFNTDPHPGNLAVDEASIGGRLIMYDFGQVSYLLEDQCDGILQLIQSIVDLDAPACVKAMDKLGAVVQGANFKVLEAKIEDNFKTGKVKSKRSKRKSDSADDAENKVPPKDSEVMKNFQLPSQLAFAARAITQMNGVGVMLDEDFEFIDLVADKVPEVQMEKGAGLDYLAGQFFKQFGR